MPAIAHFSQIKDAIISQLRKTIGEVCLAVAWLTDEDLIRVMTQLQKDARSISIIISNSKENFVNVRKFKNYLAAGGNLFICDAIFMHHKFCIIDGNCLINGSYNWSYTACNSEENVVIYTSEGIDDTESRLIRQFKSRYQFIINKFASKITDYNQLLNFVHPDYYQILSADDLRLSRLREEFELAVKASIDTARALKIPLNYDGLLERMNRDGGGVYFVKRIMRDEMNASEMKSGFKKLEALIPHRVDLSLEYLVCIPRFRELFTSAEFNFCIILMKKYDLFKDE